MAITLAKLRDRIQGHIRDVDNRRSTFQPQELDLTICDALLWLESGLPASSLHASSALTISAGGETFALPTLVATLGVTGWGTAEYAGDIRLQRVLNGQFLIRRTTEELDAMRNFYRPNTYLAIPYYFALWREKDETVQGRVWPGAATSDVYNVFVNLSADDLRDFVGSGAGNLDTVSVNLSRIGQTALIYHCAAELLAMMVPEDLATRKINPNVIPLWTRKAMDAKYSEATRRHRLEEQGRTQRWVS